MRKRTKAREIALQVLYTLDITGDDPDKALDNFWAAQEGKVEQPVKEFAEKIVRGVARHRDTIDTQISSHAKNWELRRMPTIDRNILRLGVFELIYCQDIPVKVSINEAIDLAKKYSGTQAGKFVNGILDKIKDEKPE